MPSLGPVKDKIQQHWQLAQSLFATKTARFKQDKKQAGTTVIKFTSGIQQGVTTQIKEQSFKIGADFANDVVLLGDNEPDHALTISVVKTALGNTASVKINDPSVEINGKAPVDTNETIITPFPMTIGTADAAITLSYQSAKPVSSNPANRLRKRIAGMSHVGRVALVGMIIFIAMFLFSFFAVDQRYVLRATQGSDTTLIAPEIRMLRAMRKEAEVAQLGELTIDYDDTDGILFSGTIDEDRVPVWERLKSEWNNRFAGVNKTDSTRVVSFMDVLPPVSFVKMGDNGYVQLLTNERISIGEEISDGWRLVGVEKTRLLVQRRDMLLAVNYGSVE